ncbi:MAG: VCBS repeat-containing protein, partial [Chitinophagaceae bacterium]|nr:VCBS repeat-containing protein [Chitinophagaceae bacterium]
MKKILFLLINFFQVLNSIAQIEIYRPNGDAKVFQNGKEALGGFCGGINSIQIVKGDLNQDGRADLVLYDQVSHQVKTFLNVSNINEIKYEYNPKYANNFPPIYSYLKLIDYNCDGVPDLFHKGQSGVWVYKGYYQNNELKFTFYKELRFPGAFGFPNVYSHPQEIPNIVDVDGDGDLDVLAFDVQGNFIVYYKNLRKDGNYSCDSMRMVLEDNCWGKLQQPGIRLHNLNITCTTPQIGYKGKERHTGNCPLAIDIDNDGDLDLLNGHVDFGDLQFFRNGGTSTANLITAQDTVWSANNDTVKLPEPNWLSPFYEDIDNDGKKDLLITSHEDGINRPNFNAVMWYKNTGTTALPNFVYQNDSLLTNSMIDVGQYSKPTLFDYDKDGKLDLFIGNEGYLNNQTTISSAASVAYYRNNSTVSTIQFELITRDFLNISLENHESIAPQFGDADGDGIDDFIIGLKNGTLNFYKNSAVSNSVTPILNLTSSNFQNINVGGKAMPIFYDFDLDGKKDLLIGNDTGHLAFFKDVSTIPNQKTFNLIKNNLGDYKTAKYFTDLGQCAPAISIMDFSNKDELLIGNQIGHLERFDSSFVNNFGNFSRTDSTYANIKTGYNFTPVFGDLNNDGIPELIAGNSFGGLHFYKRVTETNALKEINPTTMDIT